MAKLDAICRQLDREFEVETGLAGRDVVPALRQFIRSEVDAVMADDKWNVEVMAYPGLVPGSVFKIAYITRDGKVQKGTPSRFSVCKREVNELDRKAAKAAGASFHYDEAGGIDHLSAFMRKRTSLVVASAS